MSRFWTSLVAGLLLFCSSSCGGGGGFVNSSADPNVSVSLSPATASVGYTQSQQFNARVTGASDPSVTWSVNNIPGGNPTVGTINSGGLYSAPAMRPSSKTLSVTATSVADTSKFATATVKLTSSDISPTSIVLFCEETHQFTTTLSGGVAWSVNGAIGGTAEAGTITSSGLYTAPESFADGTTVTVSVSSLSDPTQSASATVTLRTVFLSLTPKDPTVGLGQTEDFLVAIIGDVPDPTLIFSVNGIDGGNATVGTISSSGLYTAPASPPSGDKVTVEVRLAFLPHVKCSTVVKVNSITIGVTPTTASVRLGQSQQITATVTGSSNTGVTWSVNGANGGNAAVGTIGATGLYTAPATLPSPNSVTITATSVVDTSKSSSAAVSLLNPVPVVGSFSPASINIGAFTLTVTGSNFVSGAQVMFGGSALPTTFVSSTQLTATGTATLALAGTVHVTVVNPDPGSATSNMANVPVPGVNVAVSPTPVNLRVGQTQQFTSNLTGAVNASVTWAVNGVNGGNSTVGTISATGLYTAPPALPSPNSVAITATSVVDTSKSASAAVALLNPVPVIASLSPSPSPINIGAFNLTVAGSNFVAGAQAMFGGSALATTFVSSTQLTATGTATLAQVGTVHVTVVNPDPGSATSNAADISVPGVSVEISPTLIDVPLGPTQQFTSNLTGATDMSVT